MNDKKTGCAQALASLALVAALLVSTYTVTPWIWGWYLVPLGAPAITWRHALGVMMLKGVWFHRESKEKPAGWDLVALPAKMLLTVWVATAIAYWFRP